MADVLPAIGSFVGRGCSLVYAPVKRCLERRNSGNEMEDSSCSFYDEEGGGAPYVPWDAYSPSRAVSSSTPPSLPSSQARTAATFHFIGEQSEPDTHVPHVPMTDSQTDSALIKQMNQRAHDLAQRQSHVNVKLFDQSEQLRAIVKSSDDAAASVDASKQINKGYTLRGIAGSAFTLPLGGTEHHSQDVPRKDSPVTTTAPAKRQNKTANSGAAVKRITELANRQTSSSSSAVLRGMHQGIEPDLTDTQQTIAALKDSARLGLHETKVQNEAFGRLTGRIDNTQIDLKALQGNMKKTGRNVG